MSELFTDIRYVLFDWGGTLCSVAQEEQAWRDCIAALLSAAREDGLPVNDGHTDSLRALFLKLRAQADADPGHREIRLIPALAEWLGEQGMTSVPQDTLERMDRAYWNRWVGCLHVLDGADRTLRTLGARGYRVGVVSNVTAPPHWCRLELERLGLWQLLNCATFSSEVGVRKPHPRTYDDALGKIGDGLMFAAKQALFVGDSRRCDIVGPAKRGLRTVWVCHTDEKWPEDEFQGVRPDMVINSVGELLPHLPGPA